MYEEIEIDGEIIKLKTHISEEETGIVIYNNNLEDTMDLSKELEELQNGSTTN